ncbi:three-Cys-motif partner protein TcmP [Anabaena sp. UHCC 0204]|uniref:three-Cys-motif partner protein TcmP n=1 Tax=Anabaena sp. UHCC 0204 TaxID=2590009 RepID=UPI001444FF20|nr:three-Cys-motif partner protein TcmP [Anabaena sp. UHCC 0204]MTJ10408.1 three-Cys-motif partner protein TcmP [Anabaena sp. UHCC 0204]
MSNDSFFDEPKEQSLVKARIVEKYFWAWAKVIIAQIKSQKSKGRRVDEKIAYIDLFAGTGMYKDGSKSTPIKVLEKAISDPDIRNMLVTLFNDAKVDHIYSLQKAIDAITGIDDLKYKPEVTNFKIGEKNLEIFDVPTLFFLDPYSYKGLSLNLIYAVVKNWGCDCLFFFNYNRINMDLTNPIVEDDINDLFGKIRADIVRKKLKLIKSENREFTIIEAICEALKEIGIKYVQPFRFKHEKKKRTSHHLIFVSKDKRGYQIIKDIMAKESSYQNQGVPSFEYNPADYRQLSLFESSTPLDDLEQMLLDEFASQTMSMEEIYIQHNVGRNYIKQNYQTALKNLESQGKITTEPPINERRKNTFGDSVKVTFPPKQ